MAAGSREYPVEHFPDASSWAEWLGAHHGAEPGVWLRLAKAASGQHSVSYSDALEVALCYGWIDGQSKRMDDEWWLQKFTPRGRRSVWSKKNRERVESLVARGAMQPAGIAAVEAAKEDGRWERAYDSPGSATVPDDLQEAFSAHPEAAAFFATLKSTNRYAILHRIQTAVKPETRARRIQKFIDMLERRETLYP
jgi:uncharacterized protein YdeI (YjbR/CyaY-like superfamily)